MDNSYYKNKLLDIFGRTRNDEQIDEAIDLALESYSSEDRDVILEVMINYLIESGDCCEGAVGYDLKQINELKQIFTDANHDYLKEFYQAHIDKNLPELVELLSKENYKQDTEKHKNLFKQLQDMLPDADPTYLEQRAKVLVKGSNVELEAFIQKAIEKPDYPTYQDYLKKKEVLDELAIYKPPFNMEKFLEKHPQPLEEFRDREPYYIAPEDAENMKVAKVFLFNHFPYLRKSIIEQVFNDIRSVILCNKTLKHMRRAFKYPRDLMEPIDTDNKALLQEMCFVKNEHKIRQFIKQRDERYRIMYEEARKYGLLETCTNCYNDDFIPEEMFFCQNNCIFCKCCVKTWSETIIGRAEIDFPCMACDSEFSYSTLKMVLDAKIFDRLCKRKQSDELKKANIEGMESCPFCEFTTVPKQGDKIFKCENPDCMKQSCRECKHLSHLPLRCNEVEYDEDVKMRTFIENKMTEALLRKCTNCGRTFIKESGCNKMTCLCGSYTCYVCGQTIRGYDHFGTIPAKCPLYTDLETLHRRNVLDGANNAKRELGVLQNPNKLKFDPTKNF